MADLHIWEWPLSVIMAAIFVVVLALCVRKPAGSRVRRLAESHWLAMGLLVVMAALMAIEGTWGIPLHRSWPCWIVVLAAMLVLGLVTLANWHQRSAAFTCSHLGLLILLFGGFFGAPDVTDAQLLVSRHKSAHLAYTAEGDAVPLPFEVRLADFDIDYYPDGNSPRQYTSTLLIDGNTLRTSVNHPCRYKGYRFYQMDYDHDERQYSVLKVVRDPWLGVVFAGMLCLAVGAVLSLKVTWRSRYVLPAVLVLAVVFAIASIARIRISTLPPALRSVWFVPHLIVYMLAYAVMAVAVVTGLLSLCGKKIDPSLPGRLLSTSASLLLAGMLCGAVWAKAAWGDYWTWDAKECWAAATWLLALTGSHLPPKHRHGALLVATLLAFGAIQVTWYGVNHLPAAKQSIHTYNRVKQ